MPLILRLSKGTELTHEELDDNFEYLEGLVSGISGGISLTDISVTTGTASEGGSLSYDNTTGAFTFVPADLSSAGGGIALTDLSVSTLAASGSGSLAYDDVTGVFSFTPPVVGGGSASLVDLVDTSIITPSDGQILRWRDGQQAWLNEGLQPDNLSDIQDVEISSPSDGQALVYNSANDNWVNGIPAIDQNQDYLNITNLDVGSSISPFFIPANTDFITIDNDNAMAAGTFVAGTNMTITRDGNNFTFDAAGGTGGIALTDLSVTTTTASTSGSLAYNNSTGVFTYSPVAHQNYALLTANGSSTGSLSPSNENDILYFKGGTNVTITAGSSSGTGDFSALTLDTLTFDVDLSSVSGSAGFETGVTYLQTAGQAQVIPYSLDPGPAPIIWAAVNNNNAASSFTFGNTGNIATPQVDSQGVFTVVSSTFLRVDFTAFITVNTNNAKYTYNLQTSPTGQNSWTTAKSVIRAKSAQTSPGEVFADSFWSIFKVDGQTDIRITISASGSNAGNTLVAGTQLEIRELS
jgi:hypothetical protein